MLWFIVFVEQGQRRIPVQFAKRVVGRKQYAGQSTYIPLKVNQAGVIPIIFASAVLNLPVLLSQVLPADGWGAVGVEVDQRQPGQHDQPALPDRPRVCSSSASPTSTRRSRSTRSNRPTTCASRAASSPASVRVRRPRQYLTKVLNRITLPGALFIAVLAILPTILVSIPDRWPNGNGAAYSPSAAPRC